MKLLKHGSYGLIISVFSGNTLSQAAICIYRSVLSYTLPCRKGSEGDQDLFEAGIILQIGCLEAKRQTTRLQK